jgi:hypothetical protein
MIIKADGGLSHIPFLGFGGIINVWDDRSDFFVRNVIS